MTTALDGRLNKVLASGWGAVASEETKPVILKIETEGFKNQSHPQTLFIILTPAPKARKPIQNVKNPAAIKGKIRYSRVSNWLSRTQTKIRLN